TEGGLPCHRSTGEDSEPPRARAPNSQFISQSIDATTLVCIVFNLPKTPESAACESPIILLKPHISEDHIASTTSPTMLKRAAASAYLGSVIEYYDFFVYSVCAALVFKDVFFSVLPPLVGTLASLATFTTGYLARPIGGIVFGHFGDRLGRKRMLVLTMMIMGVSSTAIGLLPTYETAGVIAPILLIVIRLLQGFALGGEWGGAMLMSAEH